MFCFDGLCETKQCPCPPGTQRVHITLFWSSDRHPLAAHAHSHAKMAWKPRYLVVPGKDSESLRHPLFVMSSSFATMSCNTQNARHVTKPLRVDAAVIHYIVWEWPLNYGRELMIREKLKQARPAPNPSAPRSVQRALLNHIHSRVTPGSLYRC